MVKAKVYTEFITKKETHLYEPDTFREFCISAGATKLFDSILSAVTTSRHSSDRIDLNKKRVVSVIYNMCYCLSQACNPLQIDHALYLRSSQINQEGLETEHIMGHSCARRTVNNVVNMMSKTHYQSFKDFIDDAIKNKWLLVLIIDDYTSVHTKRRPQEDKASEAKSMCTIVVKAFKQIPAITVQQANFIHDPNAIELESCHGIITSASSMHDLSCSYASIMPDWLTEAFFNPELQRQRLNIHQYCESDNVPTMRKMDDLQLADFVELQLKSKGDFEAAYDVVIGAGLGDYMREFVVIQPGDWPCQFYCRQIIYQCLKKFISHNPDLDDTIHRHFDMSASHNHSAYSYPSTTASGYKSFPKNLTSQPSLLSIIPTIGPLHISLNSREHVINSFHPFFKTIHESIFPKSKFADNPKPWRMSLILEIVYGGWTLIRQTVMAKFFKFKDVEYGTLLNLLDNYIPLILSIYSISFKLNNFAEYFRAMIRIWIMFTCLNRCHYNKAPLVWINMCSHWGKYSPELYKLLCNYITVFDEYPVENTHSILRAQTKSSDSADQLRKKAKTIFQSKEKQCNFRSFFTAPKQFSFSHNQLQFLKVKCAQLLSSIFKQLSQTPGQSSFSSEGRSRYVTLPAVCSNNPMKTNVLPLGFHCVIKPDPTKTCDLPECEISEPDEEWVLFNGCFHSFHNVCIKESTSCPLCRHFLQQKVKELSKIAKQAILHPASDMPEMLNDNNENPTTASSTDEIENENLAVRGMERDELENVIGKLNDEISSLEPPPHPHVITNGYQPPSQSTSNSTSRAPPHCTKCHHPVRGHKRSRNTSNISCNFCPNTTCISTPSSSSCTCDWHRANKINNRKQQASQPAPQTNYLTVIGNHYLDVNEWLLPLHICQSMIGGRQTGSNACTIISMLTGLHFLEASLPIPKEIQDLSQTIPVYSQLLFKGNHIYSFFNLPPQQPHLDVKQVLDMKDENLQNLTMISDNGFFSPQHLEDYIVQYHRRNPKFAAVLIVPPDKSMALCFDHAVMCLFESRSHGLQGAIISTSCSGNVSNFVQYLKGMVMRDWQTHLHGANLAVLGLKR